MEIDTFPGRLAIQQRVLPAYRLPFFDLLAERCAGGLSVFAGQPLAQENILTGGELRRAHFVAAHNRHFSDPSTPFYRCWQGGLLAWLESWQPDVLIVEANPRYLSTPQAIQWMHARNRPVLGWGLGAPPVSGRFGFLRRRSRLALLRSLDGLIAYSRAGAQQYCDLGFPAGRVFVAANAVTPRPAAPPPERPAAPAGRPVVLFVGRLQERKRIDHLLSACAVLPQELQPRVWIVGDGPARAAFEGQAAHLYPQAEFFGARHGPELDELFAAADLFVLPGTGGLAVQQAMAAGLPVIVAEGDGTQSELVRPENGWLIPPNDPQALAVALTEALSDLPRLRRMGAAAYRIVAEEVNLEAMAAVFVRAAATL